MTYKHNITYDIEGDIRTCSCFRNQTKLISNMFPNFTNTHTHTYVMGWQLD